MMPTMRQALRHPFDDLAGAGCQPTGGPPGAPAVPGAGAQPTGLLGRRSAPLATGARGRRHRGAIAGLLGRGSAVARCRLLWAGLCGRAAPGRLADRRRDRIGCRGCGCRRGFQHGFGRGIRHDVRRGCRRGLAPRGRDWLSGGIVGLRGRPWHDRRGCLGCISGRHELGRPLTGSWLLGARVRRLAPTRRSGAWGVAGHREPLRRDAIACGLARTHCRASRRPASSPPTPRTTGGFAPEVRRAVDSAADGWVAQRQSRRLITARSTVQFCPQPPSPRASWNPRPEHRLGGSSCLIPKAAESQPGHNPDKAIRAPPARVLLIASVQARPMGSRATRRYTRRPPASPPACPTRRRSV